MNRVSWRGHLHGEDPHLRPTVCVGRVTAAYNPTAELFRQVPRHKPRPRAAEWVAGPRAHSPRVPAAAGEHDDPDRKQATAHTKAGQLTKPLNRDDVVMARIRRVGYVPCQLPDHRKHDVVTVHRRHREHNEDGPLLSASARLGTYRLGRHA